MLGLLGALLLNIYIYIFFIFIFFLPPPSSFKRKRTYLGKARQNPASSGGRHCRKEEVLVISELLTLRFREAAGLAERWQGAESLRKEWEVVGTVVFFFVWFAVGFFSW